MCPYMRVKENELPRCKPKDMICTMCVMGDAKTYLEIENAEKQKGANKDE